MKDHIAIFNHHIYEYKKGLRRLVLYTGASENQRIMEQRLRNQNISFLFSHISERKINCFFGDAACIEVIQSFGEKPLNELTVQEDFILGALLGYDLHQQCERYLGNVNRTFLPRRKIVAKEAL